MVREGCWVRSTPPRQKASVSINVISLVRSRGNEISLDRPRYGVSGTASRGTAFMSNEAARSGMPTLRTPTAEAAGGRKGS